MFSVFVSSTDSGVAPAERAVGNWVVSRVSNLDVRCFAAPGGARLFAGTQGDGLWHSDDRGKTWAKLDFRTAGHPSILARASIDKTASEVDRRSRLPREQEASPLSGVERGIDGHLLCPNPRAPPGGEREPH